MHAYMYMYTFSSCILDTYKPKLVNNTTLDIGTKIQAFVSSVTLKCDWILEYPTSTHKYKYLEIPILII